MSDALYPLPLRQLLGWILAEEREGQIFGIPRELFFIPAEDDVFRLLRYGHWLETPVGVAAGPHTQLAQNIVAAWLVGARYLELKTVQTLDELELGKPCIDMEDEGYNCEWSQELRLEQSFQQYLDAWILIHLLKHRFGWGDPREIGMIFNLSVGYDLAGIQQPNVQHFLDRMENCRPELEARLEEVAGLYPGVMDLKIPARLSDNVTLSTMHGCPPAEIEKISRYLIGERNLHMTVKLNPTLLGPQRLRDILNRQLGYAEVRVPDEAFEHDLEYDQALTLIKNLEQYSREKGLQFGLKLTNTLEVVNHKSVLPANERRIYLSGRALHPISINLARQLQNDFQGRLDISFCAGVDAFNVAAVLACNLNPVTVCSDLLKPGGYGRLAQYLEEIRLRFREAGARNMDEFIQAGRESSESVTGAGLRNLNRYADQVLSQPAYQKHHSRFTTLKTSRELQPFDCIQAPCIQSCAAEQDIPQYIYHTAQGDFQKALEVILDTNPLPGITGYVCDHLCQLKCTRNQLDSPLLIREIKRFVTERQTDHRPPRPAGSKGIKVAIIGAGPAGLSGAYFLAREGFTVDVYEAKGLAGGMVSDAIPAFRLPDGIIRRDIARIENLGARIHYRTAVDGDLFQALRRSHDYLFLAVGAQQNKRLGIPGEDLSGILEPLAFLSAVRRGEVVPLGPVVVVIGGGNTALDAARTAVRLVGKGGTVIILYRRTRQEMPADGHEIEAALGEGIRLEELAIPQEILGKNGRVKSLKCSRMKLGAVDSSGRPRPEIITGSEFELEVDTLIPAIGQEVVLDFLPAELREADSLSDETGLPGVYAGGDAVRGASTVLQAIGDGQQVARNIIRAAGLPSRVRIDRLDKGLGKIDFLKNSSRRRFGIGPLSTSTTGEPDFNLTSRTLTEEEAMVEASRCLYCDDLCNLCVGVCPNLANISYLVEPVEYRVQQALQAEGKVDLEDLGALRVQQQAQIINLGDFCNECGNCTTFCPTSGAPYQTKPRFYLTRASFEQEEAGYYLEGNTLEFKSADRRESLQLKDGVYAYETAEASALLDRRSFSVQEVAFKTAADQRVDFGHAARMALLLNSLREFYLFTPPGG